MTVGVGEPPTLQGREVSFPFSTSTRFGCLIARVRVEMKIEISIIGTIHDLYPREFARNRIVTIFMMRISHCVAMTVCRKSWV